MYVTMRRGGGEAMHVAVTVERGFRAGTWKVSYEPTKDVWLARSPGGSECGLAGTEVWMGDLRREFDDLVCRIARRAVGEALHRYDAERSDRRLEDVSSGAVQRAAA